MPAAIDALVEVPGNETGAGAARGHCQALERGKVLFFRSVPFDFPQADRGFLLSQKQAGSRFHKNISYRPASDVLNGVSPDSPDRARLHDVMRRFSREVQRFTAEFLAPYAGKLKLDFASFRPLEERSRDLPLHKRNDLLHVDAFPTRPTRGGRILRVFVNINPAAGRVWNVGEAFDVVVPRMARTSTLAPAFRGPLARWGARVAASAGLPVPDRSRYDEFMLYLHDWFKENSAYQENGPKEEVVFPPGCAWMVFTDGVPHAALSGQYALEQTFIVPLEALVAPEAAPLRVLESITKSSLE
ncbi:MAG TPA: Kdo hydroxylase family protein [Methylomirabilota bacterium]|nr:Kdo hydroxylase family protein [Methylomirabilota bacterium]